MFNRGQQPAFDKLKSRIAVIQDAGNQGAQAQQTSAGEIEQLAALMDRGLVTREEFEAKKKQILGL